MFKRSVVFVEREGGEEKMSLLDLILVIVVGLPLLAVIFVLGVVSILAFLVFCVALIGLGVLLLIPILFVGLILGLAGKLKLEAKKK